MKGTLVVNCGNVLLLTDKEGVLQQYDSIVFNCGNVTISDEVNNSLANQSVVFNCGKTTIVKAPKNPVRTTGRITLDAQSDFSDKYLVADDVVVTPGGIGKITQLEGLLVQGTLYYPQSLSSGALANVNANRLAAYPDEAELIFDDVTLDRQTAARWQADKTYYIAQSLFAMETEPLESLRAKGIKIACNKLYISQSANDAHTALFTAHSASIIPDGFRIACKAMSLPDLFANYGSKVYILESLTIPRKDHRHLSLFESILIKGRVTVSLDHLEDVKRIVSADSLRTYEGELMNINSFQILNRAALSAALQNGTRYTVTVNGALLLDEDVTLEDVQAICSLTVNGVILAPSVTHPYLSGIASINGTMLGSIPEIMKMIESTPEEARKALSTMLPGPLKSILGLKGDDDAGSVVNCGSYVLL